MFKNLSQLPLLRTIAKLEMLLPDAAAAMAPNTCALGDMGEPGDSMPACVSKDEYLSRRCLPAAAGPHCQCLALRLPTSIQQNKPWGLWWGENFGDAPSPAHGGCHPGLTGPVGVTGGDDAGPWGHSS